MIKLPLLEISEVIILIFAEKEYFELTSYQLSYTEPMLRLWELVSDFVADQWYKHFTAHESRLTHRAIQSIGYLYNSINVDNTYLVHAMKRNNVKQAIQIAVQIRTHLVRLQDTVSALRDLRKGFPEKIVRQLQTTEQHLSSLVDRSTATIGSHDTQALSISTSIYEKKKRIYSRQVLSEMNASSESEDEDASYIDLNPLHDDLMPTKAFAADECESLPGDLDNKTKSPSTIIQVLAT